MALSTYWPTLVDLARQTDPNGKVATIAELLNVPAPILDDIPFLEANKVDGHLHTMRTALPGVTKRQLNAGVLPTKTAEKNTTDVITMIETYSEVDVKLAQLSGDVAKFRLNQAKAHLEAITQEMARQIFYGNPATDPAETLGLAPRYSTLGKANNVLDGGSASGQTDNTSIWLVVWNPDNGPFGIYPKGSTQGLDSQDLGEVTNVDANGKRWQIFRSHFLWHAGLAVSNPKQIVRIANIDVSDLETAGDPDATNANLMKLMSQAIDLIQNMDAGQAVFYMNNTVMPMFRVLAENKANAHLTTADYLGKSGFTRSATLMYHGIPIRRCDQIVDNETRLT